MRNQNTLRSSVCYTGVGTHSGEIIHLKLEPAPEDTGVVFIRDDLSRENRIPALYKYVSSSPLCTKLTNEYGASVSTVEHLLAALYAKCIDNVYVHVSGSEVPIFDGSALEIIQLLDSVGIVSQKAAKRALFINKDVSHAEQNKLVRMSPNPDGLRIEITCDFSKQGLGASSYEYDHSPESFIREIAFSRTFGFFEDACALKKAGLAKGSSLDNAVIFKDGQCVNPSGLRSSTEYITHKILDIIGDLSVSGYEIHGHFYGLCPGHTMNGALVKKIFSDPSNFRIES